MKRKATIDFKKKIAWLHIEMDQLKTRIFNDSMFVIIDDKDPKVQRYNQLLGFFKPEFRYEGWINPLSQDSINIINREKYGPVQYLRVKAL